MYLIRFKHKNAYEGNHNGVNIFYSYNTPIAFNIASLDITIITSSYYSNTTAHHKTDARRLYGAAYNIEVKPEVFSVIIDAINAGYQEAKNLFIEILDDYKLFSYLVGIIKGTNPGTHKRNLIDYSTSSRKPEKTNYKNGNFKDVYYYTLKTTFFKVEYKTVKHAYKVNVTPNSKQQHRGVKSQYTYNYTRKRYIIRGL